MFILRADVGSNRFLGWGRFLAGGLRSGSILLTALRTFLFLNNYGSNRSLLIVTLMVEFQQQRLVQFFWPLGECYCPYFERVGTILKTGS